MALFLAIFIAIAIVVGVIAFVLIGKPDPTRQIARRLEGSAPEQQSYEVSASDQLMRDEQMSTVPALNRALAKWSKADSLQTMITQAGMDTKPGQVILMTAVLALGTYLVLHLFLNNVLISAVCGLVAGAVPIATVYQKRLKRMRDFEKNFPEAIDLLARAVRAGHALNTGMEIVGQEMTEPIAGEFRKTFEEQRLGLQFREAVVNLSQRVPLQDTRFFAAALIIQDETGGNLAEILGNLSSTMRDRFKIRGEVRVKTAQGRLTAAILMALPPSMLVLLNFLNPQYSRVLYTDPLGLIFLGSALVLQIIGGLILWKIVNIEI